MIDIALQEIVRSHICIVFDAEKKSFFFPFKHLRLLNIITLSIRPHNEVDENNIDRWAHYNCTARAQNSAKADSLPLLLLANS